MAPSLPYRQSCIFHIPLLSTRRVFPSIYSLLPPPSQSLSPSPSPSSSLSAAALSPSPLPWSLLVPSSLLSTTYQAEPPPESDLPVTVLFRSPCAACRVSCVFLSGLLRPPGLAHHLSSDFPHQNNSWLLSLFLSLIFQNARFALSDTAQTASILCSEVASSSSYLTRPIVVIDLRLTPLSVPHLP